MTVETKSTIRCDARRCPRTHKVGGAVPADCEDLDDYNEQVAALEGWGTSVGPFGRRHFCPTHCVVNLEIPDPSPPADLLIVDDPVKPDKIDPDAIAEHLTAWRPPGGVAVVICYDGPAEGDRVARLLLGESEPERWHPSKGPRPT
jgi:hypothetical protein